MRTYRKEVTTMKKLFDIVLATITVAAIIVLFFCGEEGMVILGFIGIAFGIGVATTLYVVHRK